MNMPAPHRTDVRAGGLRALLLPDHNDRLELMLDEVILHWEDTNGRGPFPLWRRFRDELERHLEVEERMLLPLFAATHPAEAANCLALHGELKGLVVKANSELELHARQAPSLLALQRLQRQHGRRTEHLLYPWAVEALDPAAWKSVRTEMRKLLFDVSPQHQEDES
jgi:hypothetical protein